MGLRKKFLFGILTALLMFNSTALAQPPDYNGEVIIVDAVVSGNTATISNLSGNAGDTIVANVPLSVDGSSISQISFKLKNGISGGKVTVTVINQPSVAGPPGALGFFKIDLEGFTDDDIESAEIVFKVDNKFVSVTLYRLSGGTWAALNTSRVSVGSDTSTYKGDTPGFSEFAIVAQEGAAKTTPSGKLPFTGGLPLYMVGGLGLIFIFSGIAIRLKAQSK